MENNQHYVKRPVKTKMGNEIICSPRGVSSLAGLVYDSLFDSYQYLVPLGEYYLDEVECFVITYVIPQAATIHCYHWQFFI